MDQEIPLTIAARLSGDSDGTYRSAISQYLPDVGRRAGKERRVNIWETAGLRTLTERSSAKVGLKEAAQRVVQLMPFLERIARRELNGNVFAVELWGRVGEKYQRAGYVCEG